MAGAKKRKHTKSTDKADQVLAKKKVSLAEGMRDALPVNQPFWRMVENRIRDVAYTYGYKKMDVPVVEHAALYEKIWGKTSQLVSEELYALKEGKSKALALRPDLMGGLARAYVEHGMYNQDHPLKLYLSGPAFRTIKPQASFYRQHHISEYHIVGDGKPISDAEPIIVSWKVADSLDIPAIAYINSVGCTDCKPDYKTALSTHYKPMKKRLCKDCTKVTPKDMYKVLLCKEQKCIGLRESAPQSVDYLCDSCKSHFMKVLEFLDDAGIPYILHPHFTADPNVYNGTSFLLLYAGENEESSGLEEGELEPIYGVMDGPVLAEGGRYDQVYTSMGMFEPVQASFVRIVSERLMLYMRQAGQMPKDEESVDLFVAQLGEQAKKKTFELVKTLRAEGWRVRVLLNKHDLKSQLASAQKVNARFTLIMGHKEVLDGTILIRDMDGGSQEVVDYNKVLKEVHKRFCA